MIMMRCLSQLLQPLIRNLVVPSQIDIDLPQMLLLVYRVCQPLEMLVRKISVLIAIESQIGELIVAADDVDECVHVLVGDVTQFEVGSLIGSVVLHLADVGA